VIDASMIEAMKAKVGARLRIDHSVNNEVASRIAVTKFAGGIGDINPLWTDPDYATGSPYGARGGPAQLHHRLLLRHPVRWPGLGSFHSSRT